MNNLQSFYEGFTVGQVETIGGGYYAGDPLLVDPCITTPWYYTPTKSAREQVQEEILTKMASAIESDDLKKARELVKLAKALKEL